jgi:hypothetical protein
MSYFSFKRVWCGLLVLAGPLVCAAAGAVATPAATYDPAQLPTFHGKVGQYDLASDGDVDGLILDSGLEVHTSPHQAAEVAAAVRPGDPVTIHGLKARELGLVRARSLTNDNTAATVLDSGDSMDEHGRDGGHGRHRGHHRGGGHGTAGDVHGKIKMQLHDTDGNVDGVLLIDGTIVHFPSQMAIAKAAQLAPGQDLFVQGDVTVSDLGRLVNAHALGSSAADLLPVPEMRGR